MFKGFNTLILYYTPDVSRKCEGFTRDEYQDVSYAQKELCRLLSVNGSILAVGDDCQNIYSWRNASMDYILGFKEDYPKACIMNLERNYRSTGNIVKASNAVIKHNLKKFHKEAFTKKDTGIPVQITNLLTDSSEGFFVCQKIRELYAQGVEYKDIAVLYRTNAQSRAIEEALRNGKVPYNILSSTNFYDRKEVRDVVAYIQLLYNSKNDIAFKRILNVPRRGFGKVAAQKLVDYAKEHECSLYEAAQKYQDLELSKKQKESLANFLNMFDVIGRQLEGLPFHEVITNLVLTIDYIGFLGDDKDAVDNINQLVVGCMAYDTIEDFLEGVALMSDTDKLNEEKTVKLMTIHSSKGLEFDTVFIVGVEEDLLPHFNSYSASAIEEERRLFYVAMTRAADRLYITSVKERYAFNKDGGFIKREKEPSRFLDEIPREHCLRNDLTVRR